MSTYTTTGGPTTTAPMATGTTGTTATGGRRFGFGRNRAATTGATTVPASTTATGTGGGRFGRKKASGPSALAKNEMEAPQMRYVEWRSKSGERWGVVRAKIQEKFSRVGADVSYGVFSVTHPIHPVRRHAAKDAMQQKKALAADRRVQQESAAHSIAAAKRANMRQERVNTLNQAVH